MLAAVLLATAGCGGKGGGTPTDGGADVPADTGRDVPADTGSGSCDPALQDCAAGSKCDFGCQGTTAVVACRADNGSGALGDVCSAAVRDDMGKLEFNTAIAALMEYLNVLAEGGVNRATRADLDTMIRLVAPFAPHLADEAWERFGGKGFALQAAWPAFDPALTIDDTVSIGVQVDGKLRGSVDIAPGASEDAARAAALALPNVAKHLEGRAIKKFIYKPGRIIGLVTAPVA